MAKLYQRFIRVLQKWPVDPQLTTKSLAGYMREQGNAAFSKQGEFTGNVEQCEKRLAALERLVKNHWSQQYPRPRNSGALGLPVEQLKLVLSEEFQKEFEGSTFSLLDKIKGAFKKKSGNIKE